MIIVKLRTNYVHNPDEKPPDLRLADDMMKLPMPKITPPKTDLGAEIRRLRERVLHLSQPALGDALDVRGNVISRWETGVNLPSVQSLARLAQLAAKTKAEEQRLFHELVRMAGSPKPYQGEGDAPSRDLPRVSGDQEVAPAGTIEGQMARAIVDYVTDQDMRQQLVLSLLELARQAPVAAAETPPDPRPSP